MSIADRTSARARRRRSRGYTFLEMVISIAIVALMSLVVERVLTSTQDAEKYLNAVRNATERGQKMAYELREIVSASRKLYGNDVVGLGYRNALQLTRDPIVATARLPRFDEVNPMGPDQANDPHTGNVLLFVREADAAPAIATPATKKVRYIDTYRFVCVYPHITTRMVITGQPGARDLVIWRSVPFPSYGQIMTISDATERQNVVKDLYNRFGYDFAWDPNGTADTSFYGMDNLGNIAGSPTAGLVIEEDLNVSQRGRLVYANVQLARTDAASHARRSIFTVDPPANWVPDGFEVKIAGASGSRKVWIHLVVEVQAAAGRVAVQDCTVIASTKDL
jgi:prepilin-type N-terminal cleavage/methylation domain-containing protein